MALEGFEPPTPRFLYNSLVGMQDKKPAGGF